MTATSVQLTLKTTQRVADETFYNNSYRGGHIKKGRRDEDATGKQTRFETNNKLKGQNKHGEERGSEVTPGIQSMGHPHQEHGSL